MTNIYTKTNGDYILPMKTNAGFMTETEIQDVVIYPFRAWRSFNKPVIFGQWESFRDIVLDFLGESICHDANDLDLYIASRSRIIQKLKLFRNKFPGFIYENLAIAGYDEVGGWDGGAFVLYYHENKLYEVNASHCSCYGLEDQFKPEETSISFLRQKLKNGKFYMPAGFDATLREVLDKIQGDYVSTKMDKRAG